MSINVAPRMARKAVVKDLSGQVIDMVDEINGGYIIKNRRVVNKERWAELQKIEADKKLAAIASTMAITNPSAPDRGTSPSAENGLRKEFAEFKKDVDSKFDAILAVLKKK